jgi:ribonuclease HI
MSEEAATSPSRKEVTIYTDGAAVPNPGAGGYGVVLRFGNHRKELSGGFRLTTNNRMELMAVIVGLETLKEPCKVTLHSDSQYIVNAVTSGAAFRWRANGWTTNPGRTKPAKNPDLWERLLTAYERHEVEMVWVKGHAGIDDNERCDALVMAACQRDDLPLDPGFNRSESATTTSATVVQTTAPKTKF